MVPSQKLNFTLMVRTGTDWDGQGRGLIGQCLDSKIPHISGGVIVRDRDSLPEFLDAAQLLIHEGFVV
jgi:hypothetical protein